MATALTSPSSLPTLKMDVSRSGRLGALASIALLLIAVLWAQFTMIAGAVIAPGQVVVRGQPKMVQSLDGGVVEKIFVENGDVVKAGDLLLRLDPTLLRVNLDIYRTRLAEALTRKERLEAEHRGLDAPVFLADQPWLKGMDLSLQHDGQRQIFAARAEVLRGRKEQLRESIDQIHNQMAGVEGQITALRDQLGYVEKNLDNVRSLNDKGLAREVEVLDLQRTQSSMLGQIAERQAELARLANSIRDTELAILQADREFREEVVTELREVTTASEELILQIVTTQKQLDRIELRAPADGIVHELQVTTLGGVVAPGATVVQIVPLAEGVEFELHLAPTAIDEVYLGQKAKIVFPAFKSRTTPNIHGTLSAISPSTVVDAVTRKEFYRLHLTIPPEELALLGGVELVPGMPVEAFLQTDDRSALHYLTAPLSDQMARAFRDE